MEIVGGDHFRRHARGGKFDQQAKVEHFLDVADGDTGHGVALARGGQDQAVVGEANQGDPHGRQRRIVTPAEFLFRQVLPGRQGALDDVEADAAIDQIAELWFLHKKPDSIRFIF